jgi:predicted metal-dependent hydrolase
MVFFRRQSQPQQSLQDGDRLDVAGVEVLLRVSARARRISLRLDVRRRQIIATAPSLKDLQAAAAFAQRRQEWIWAQIQALPTPKGLCCGQSIMVLGQTWQLQQASGPRSPAQWLENGEDRALVCGGADEAGFRRAVLRALQARALSLLRERTQFHAQALNQPMPTVAIMDAKGRWGSCKPSPRRGFGSAVTVGQIRYSWRLILAPFEVLDYVVAHECAHLVEANHGPRFWAQVKVLVGDPSKSRAWLRKFGQDLHALGADGVSPN